MFTLLCILSAAAAPMDWVVVEGEGLAPLLAAEGFTVEVSSRGMHQLWVPPARRAELAGLPGVVRLRPPHLAEAKGEVRTEGYTLLFDAGDWHEAGHRGRGRRIAVLDLGFAGADALAGTELPADFVAPGTASSHGTSVSEILHDLAPKAELLPLVVRTDVEFFAAIDHLLVDKVDVVNASIGFDNLWHTDGSSPLSLAVDELVDATGAIWVAAAGNESTRYRIGPLADVDGDGLVELDGAEEIWVALEGRRVQASLRWSEPMDQAEVDLDLEVLTAEGVVCQASEDTQDGDDAPYESVSGDCNADEARLRITTRGDLPEGLVGHLYVPEGLDPEDATGRQSLTLPADAHHALAVGACDPISGTLAAYSSRGPTMDGRLKPELCAPHQVSTATWGAQAFHGTSAAAPHVAALAALMLSSTDDPQAELQDLALDLGPEGPDTGFGHGMAQAGPPPAGCGCATSTHPRPLAPWAFFLAALAWRRRIALGCHFG